MAQTLAAPGSLACSSGRHTVLSRPTAVPSLVRRQPACSRQRSSQTCHDSRGSPMLQTIDADEAKISNLDTNYCDDFVCTSSPAVEQTVRSLARELQRGKYATKSLYANNVSYSDGFRSFTGVEGYTRQRWLADNVDNLRVSILKMEMLDKGTAQISWRATGSLGSSQLSINFTTVAALNLLTGRIEKHKETWDLSKCGPQAAAHATASRFAWSLQQRLKDAQEGLGRATDKLSSGLGGGDDTPAANGTMDPTRFYQPGNSSNSDYVSWGLVLAMLWLAFKFFGEIEKL